nr:hypothetical protein [Micromonospora tarapacensis]
MHAFDMLGDPVRRRILELLAGGESDFWTASSEQRYEVSLAAGTSPDEARAAADRTTAFHTGAPQG